MKQEISNISPSIVAQALAADYFCIYYVNLENDKFIEYSASPEYKSFGLPAEGDDFITFSRVNFEELIHPDDRARFLEFFQKEKIVRRLDAYGTFNMNFRMLFPEGPAYVHLKITRMIEKEGRHVVIGLDNIDAQMKREQEFQEKMADARTQAKNDFLANMSHDIRTPMNAIVGYTNIAKAHLHDSAVVKDSLEKIGSASHFLLSLINDVLDISKIESGKMQLNAGDCDLAAVFRRIEDITSMQARKKNLHIVYDRRNVSHFLVRGDEMRIEQVLINIVSNAIKYTPEGKTVELRAEESEGPAEGLRHYRFAVKDTGIGISEEYLPHIFESFTREQNTKVNVIQGTGLGLAITAKVVELMNGKIAVESKLGEGSLFTVDLDLEVLTAAEECPAEAAVRERDLTGRRILLVEDNDINAEIASMVLQQYGMTTERAINGQAGLDMVKGAGEGYYDAVLMDIQMPVMNGYEASLAIRELPGVAYKLLPIIAMSANAYEDDVKACLAAGMNAHIAKPYDPEALRALLQEQIL